MNSHKQRKNPWHHLKRLIFIVLGKPTKSDMRMTAIIICSFFFVSEFLFQPCIVPSSSMYPTLLIGEMFYTDKTAYGYSYASFTPLRWIEKLGCKAFNGRILQRNEVKQGDIVVINGHGKHYANKLVVKRVVAVAGQTIQYKDGIIHINDAPIQRTYIDQFEETSREDTQYGILQHESFREGESHEVVKSDFSNTQYQDNTKKFTVPEGCVFLSGDNRDNSLDSRNEDVGCISTDDILGKAERRLISFDSAKGAWWKPWTWFSALKSRLHRWFKSLKENPRKPS